MLFRSATGESIPLLCVEGVPGLPGAPQDDAGLTRPQNISAYVLLNRRFEKVSGNVASSKRWFRLINSYFLTLSGVLFQILV